MRLPTVLLVAALLACAERSETPRPPNVVLIISDDHDYTHLGFMDHPVVRTPAIDSLAATGTWFPTGYTQPRCRPALAGLLSGRLAHHHGIYYNHGPGQLPAINLLPALLRDAGYRTFAQGKSWEGPIERLGFTDGGGLDPDLIRRDQDEVLAFLDEVGETPFLLWYAPKLPHLPHDPPSRLKDRYPEAEIPVPGWIAEEDRAKFQMAESTMHGMESWLDEGVGVLLQRLEDRGLRENTLIVFLIDNGWGNGRPSKGSPFEQGIRTPVVFSGPGIPSGVRRPGLVSYLDVMPTLLDYAGVPIPATCDGRSLRPWIDGEAGDLREALFGMVYSAFPSGRELRPERDAYAIYARTPRWKYILYLQDVRESRKEDYFRIIHVMSEFPERDQGDEELFDLEGDPEERENLAGLPEHRERMDGLRRRALEWWHSTGGGRLAIEET